MLRKRNLFIKTYEDHWINAMGYSKYLQALDVNVIRVPFWYGNFMSSPEGQMV